MIKKYTEKPITLLPAIIIALLAFVVIYTPFQIGERELSTQEGYYAAVITEVTPTIFPTTVAQGELIHGIYPLYPSIASIAYNLGLPMEYSLRLLSVFAMLLTSIIVFFVGKKAYNTEAAIVAATMNFSCFISMEKVIDGYPDMLGCMFIFISWMLWFTYGAVDRFWNKAWIYSSIFCGLAFYTLGWMALLYFALPLIFLHRPLTVWQKMKHPGFVVGIVIVLSFILIWGIPTWALSGLYHSKNNFFEDTTISDYLHHLFTYPFTFILKFFPWSLIIWAPFCAALNRLDSNVIFNRYLRTIICSVGVLMWLNPFFSLRDLIFLVPPLSVITAGYYWVIIRRYTRQYYHITRALSATLCLSAIFTTIVYLTPSTFNFMEAYLPRSLDFIVENKKYGLTLSLITFVLTLYFTFLEHRRIVLWRHLLGISVAISLMMWSTLIPYRSQSHEKKFFATIIKNALLKQGDFSDDLILYKDVGISGRYSECFYMGCKVKKIKNLSELPDNEKIVYLLSTRAPFIPGRKSKNILPKGMKYKDTTIYLWQCIIDEDDDD